MLEEISSPVIVYIPVAAKLIVLIAKVSLFTPTGTCCKLTKEFFSSDDVTTSGRVGTLFA